MRLRLLAPMTLRDRGDWDRLRWLLLRRRGRREVLLASRDSVPCHRRSSWAEACRLRGS
jgi:hypothetical protein